MRTVRLEGVDPDYALLCQVKQSRTGLNDIVKKWQPLALKHAKRFAFLYLRDQHVEDLCQEALMQVSLAVEQWDGRGKFYSYLNQKIAFGLQRSVKRLLGVSSHLTMADVKRQRVRTRSIDAPLIQGESDFTLADVLGEMPDDELPDAVKFERLLKAMPPKFKAHIDCPTPEMMAWCKKMMLQPGALDRAIKSKELRIARDKRYYAQMKAEAGTRLEHKRALNRQRASRYRQAMVDLRVTPNLKGRKYWRGKRMTQHQELLRDSPQYAKQHREKAQATMRACAKRRYYQQRDKMLLKHKLWRQKNAEKAKLARDRWRAAHPNYKPPNVVWHNLRGRLKTQTKKAVEQGLAQLLQ